MLKKLKLVRQSLRSVWCDAWHTGAVNMTEHSYECPHCQRTILYDWHIRPVGVTVTLYKKSQPAQSIFVD